MLDLSCVFPPRYCLKVHYTISRLFLVWHLVLVLFMDEALLFWISECCWIPGDAYWEVLEKVRQKNDRCNADLRGIHHFRICSWVFPFGYTADKVLVNCGDFTGDCRSIHGIWSDFRCSEDEEYLFEVIDDTFMSMGVIIFKLLSLISLVVFSNVGSGFNFLLQLCCSYLAIKDYRQTKW